MPACVARPRSGSLFAKGAEIVRAPKKISLPSRSSLVEQADPGRAGRPGHSFPKANQIYTSVLDISDKVVHGPLDFLWFCVT